MRIPLAAAVMPALLIACAQDTDAATATDVEPPAPIAGEVSAEAASTDDLVGEASEPISAARGICVGAAFLGASLGCVTAGAACSGTTTLTVGGTAYPCLIVLAVACAAVPTSAALYVQAFCPKS